jgi:hypothetical protein
MALMINLSVVMILEETNPFMTHVEKIGTTSSLNSEIQEPPKQR